MPANENNVTRGRERLRRVGLTGVFTLASRGIGIVASLVTVPITARYLGTERFGLWLLLGGFLSWVSLADLGLGNTLMTELARADGNDDRVRARLLVSSALYPVVLIAIAVAFAFGLAYSRIPWGRVFNVSDAVATREVGAAAAVTMGLFVARLPLALPGRIYAAYQEGYRYQLWSGACSVLSVLALLGTMAAGGSLPAMLGAFYGTAMLADLGAAAQLFGSRKPWLVPSLRAWELRLSRALLGTGSMFWIAQIAAILLLETDLLVVTQLFGANRVAEYGVALKLFGVVALVQMAFVEALWPAYAEALARRDVGWVQRTFARSIALGVGWAGAASALLVGFGGYAVRVLIAIEVPPGRWLLAAMATTAVVTAVGQCFAMLLNGLGDIRIQAALGVVSGVFNLVVSVVLARQIGLPGVALGTTAAIVVSLAVTATFLRARIRALRDGVVAPVVRR